MLKQWIRNVLGEYWVFRLKDLRAGLFQNKDVNLVLDTTLYESILRPGDLCFDVGANVGNKIDLLLKIGASVVAIEPQKECYRILKYKYGKKISIVNKGLGASEGILELHLSESSTIASFSKDWIQSVKKTRFQNYNWSRTESVKVTTLDNLIKQFGVPAFIKIDVEGYELEVLKGLHSSINIVSFEYTVPERTDKVLECLDYLESLNKDVVCNYSIGENMRFIYTKWISIKELKTLIGTKEFNQTEFGDIYIKSINDMP